MNSLNFKQGDIVIAELLYSEQIGLKIRPAIVISSTSYNKNSDDIILLKITSSDKKTKYDISLKKEDMSMGKLKRKSSIMIDNPVTTYKGIIKSKVGKINEKKLKEVKEKMCELYEI
jgi:mRNA interferase MazF